MDTPDLIILEQADDAERTGNRMNVIIGARQSGKTTALILQSAETGFYIVTNSHQSAQRIMQMSKNLNVNIPFPLTYEEFLRAEYDGRGVRGLLIDDTDMLLQYIARAPVRAIVINAKPKT